MDASVARALPGRISAMVVRRMLEGFEASGCSRLELLAAAGLTEDSMAGETPIAGTRVERLCERGLERSCDAAIGLRWALTLTGREFAPISHVLMHSLSLRQALALVDQYGPLLCDQRIFELHEQGTAAALRFPTWSLKSPHVRRLKAEMSVAGFVMVIRKFDPDACIHRMAFVHDAPDYHAEYRSLLLGSVSFGQLADEIVFDRALLDRRNPEEDDEVRGALTEVLDRRLMRAGEAVPFAVRVRELLMQDLPKRSEMAGVATKLGLAERSLRRRLSSEGVSFRQLQEEACGAFAQRLLLRDRATIQEIAHAMGFSDASAFHRAFKRWTGSTPQAFRGA